MSDSLPPGWRRILLRDLGEIVGGLTKGKKRRPDDVLQPVPYLRVANVQRGWLDLGEVKLIDATAAEVSALQLRHGDVLFNEGGDRDKLGRGAIWRDELPLCIHQNHVFRLRVREGADPQFVSAYGNSSEAQQYFLGSGKQTTNLASINISTLGALPVYLPPLNEQRRIVAKLEALQARSRRAREALDTVPALLEKLRQSILAAAFRGDLTKDWRAQHPDVEPASELLKRIRSERRKRWEESELAKLKAKGKPPTDDKWKAKYKEPDPVDTTGLPELPKGWCWASVDELLTALRNGISAKPDKDSGLRILRISAVRPLRVDINDVRFLAEDPAYDGYLLANGQLLLTRYNGNPELVGVAGVVRGLAEPTVYPDKLILATPLDTYIAADFLAIAFNTGATRRHIASKGKSAAGQVGISGSDIRGAPVPVPPIAEQLALVTAVQAGLVRIQAARSSAVQMAAMLSRLESAILAKAFRGELVPQDPNDEPADAMLARLARAGESGASA